MSPCGKDLIYGKGDLAQEKEDLNTLTSDALSRLALSSIGRVSTQNYH